jgi:hypothetical protein
MVDANCTRKLSGLRVYGLTISLLFQHKKIIKTQAIIPMTTWQDELQLEFERAEQARAKGNEGQARVCARRAAGLAIREYLARRGTRPSGASAYDLLNLIKEDPRLSPAIKLIADHLTVRVTDEFKLPVNADLVAEARQLCDELLSK